MRSSTIIAAVLTAPACLRRFGQKDRTRDTRSIPLLDRSLTIRDHFPVLSDVMQLP